MSCAVADLGGVPRVPAVLVGALAAVQQLVAVGQLDLAAERFMPTCCCTSSTSRRSNRLSAISVPERAERAPLREQEAKQAAEADLELEDLQLEDLLANATSWTTKLWFAPSSLARTC